MKNNPFARMMTLLTVIFTTIGAVFLTVAVFSFLRLGEVRADGFWESDAGVLCAVFAMLGGVFFLTGVSLIAYRRQRQRRKQRLLAEGRRVYAEIEQVAINAMINMNGRHPYVIHCVWRDPKSGVRYHYRSENLWFDPSRVLEQRGVRTLPVYLDEGNVKKYYVSLEGIEGNDRYRNDRFL